MWSSSDSNSEAFDRDRHIQFLQMMYQLLPSQYQSQDVNRLTLAYFVISGLDLLRALHSDNSMGFTVPEVLNINLMIMRIIFQMAVTWQAHTCALAILKTVGYDLSLVGSESIMRSMKNLQQPDGSFMPIHTGAERDLRFVFCAAAICSMLENWSGMDREKVKEYILNCQSYDGGFGLIPGAESHDDLLSKNQLSSIINVPLLLDWSLQRQAADGGFQGRSNKSTDTCYAFWIGGILRILGGHKLIDEKALRGFLLTCQSQYGGFSKFPRQPPDLYHSYYGFAAFSMLVEPGLNPICTELGITGTAAV